MKIVLIKSTGESLSINFENETRACNFFANCMENCQREEIVQINIKFN